MDAKMIKFTQKLNKLGEKAITYLSAIVGTFSLILLWLPCQIYKLFVSCAASIFRRDLTPFKGVIDTILVDEDFVNLSGSFSIVSVLQLEGNISASEVIQLFSQNVMCCTTDNGRCLRYPQLKQYPVSFMGYPFWKKDENFDLQNHISEYENINGLTVSQIHHKMLNSKYEKDRSPWQILIFRSNQQNQTFLATRVHHSISDGRSLVKLIVECLGNKPMTTREAQFKTPTFLEKLKYAILLPYELVNLVAMQMECQSKIIRHPLKRSIISCDDSPLNVYISDKIRLAQLKNVARAANVQLSAVILSAVTAAVNKFLLMEGHQTGESLPMYVILPREDHPSTLKNHLYVGLSEIPLKENEKEHLDNCIKNFMYLRQSEHGRHVNTLLYLVSVIPAPFRPKMSSIKCAIAGLSNIAGEQEGVSIGNLTCREFTMSAGLVRGSVGVNFTVVSYMKNIHIALVSKDSVLTEQQTITLLKMVQDEFAAVSKLVLEPLWFDVNKANKIVT